MPLSPTYWVLWRLLLIPALRMPAFLRDEVTVTGKCLAIRTELILGPTLDPTVALCWGSLRRMEPLCTVQTHCPQEQTLPFPRFWLPSHELCPCLGNELQDDLAPMCLHYSLALLSFQHPYPTEDEKRQIAAQTNLTLLQVNNW